MSYKFWIFSFFSLTCFLGLSCTFRSRTIPQEVIPADYISDKTPNDTDDPAIWINPEKPLESLLLGTDKGDSTGGIFVFDIKGRLIPEKCLTNLRRPNNIDVEYGFKRDSNSSLDIAVFTERGANRIRVVSLPDMNFIDGGGIPVFEDELDRSPMGIALYHDRIAGLIYAFVSRKKGPLQGYLGQYQLYADTLGTIRGRLVRKVGSFSGGKEIEAIAVDDDNGFIYFSDEGFGVKKYHAHPDSSNQLLAIFGNEGFADDQEGISIYPTGKKSGYILVSDQQANLFRVFSRESPHRELAILPLSTQQSDGSEAVAFSFDPSFPKGIFVAMSDDKTFQIFDWRKLEKEIHAQIMNKSRR